MNLADLQTKANIKLIAFWDELVLRQEEYLIKHSNYFQLITSPAIEVVDGVDTDFVVTHPSDQIWQSDVTFTWTSKVPFNISVSPWGNNSEHGYKATVVVQLPDGRKFTRSRELTDPRVRTQDTDNTDEMNPVPVGEPHYVGEVSIVTSNWVEVIDTV